MEDPVAQNNFIDADTLRRFNFFKIIIPLVLITLLLLYAGRSCQSTPIATAPEPTVIPANVATTTELNEGNAPTLRLPNNISSPDAITLTGTGIPGSSIQLFNNGVEFGNGKVDEDGNWRITGSVQTYHNEFEAFGATTEGRAIGSSGRFSLRVPNAAAPLSVAAPQLGEFSLNNRNLSAGLLDISGTGEPNTQVMLSTGDTNLGIAAIDENGRFHFAEEIALAGGSYDLIIQMLGTNGEVLDNVKQPNSLNIPLLIQAPIINLIEADPSLNNAIVISGVAPPQSDVEIVINDTVINTVTADTDGTWQYVPLWTPAEYNVVARSATDNTLTSDPTFLVVERIVTINDVLINEGGQLGARINGTAIPNQTLDILLDNEVVDTITIDANGNWSYFSELAIGDYDFTTRLTEAPAQIAEPIRLFIPPLIAINPIELTNSTEGRSGINISGNAPAQSEINILIDDESITTVTVNDEGTWLYPLPSDFPAGDYLVTARLANNSAILSQPQPLTIGRTVTINDIIVGTERGRDTAIINGRTLPNAAVELIINGEQLDTTVADTDGNWSYTTGRLAVGDYDIFIRLASDNSQASNIQTVTILPFVDIGSVDVRLTEENDSGSVTLNGRAPARNEIQLLIDGEVIDTVTADGDGNWSFTIDDLSNGTYRFGSRLLTASGDVLSDGADQEVIVGQPLGALQLLFAGAVITETEGITITVDNSNATAPTGSPVVELIVDASWSMNQPLGASTRYEVARNALQAIINTSLPNSTPIALRAFGNIEGDLSCRTDLMYPYQPLDREALNEIVTAIQPQFNANTPIAAALAQVTNDLAEAEENIIVVLLTDGEESCGGDPAAAIQQLVDAGIQVQINIVGFAIDDEALRAEFEQWAEIGGGQYFDATEPEQLEGALSQALLLPYRVYNRDGRLAAIGRVGGIPVSLTPGTYTAEVGTSPPLSLGPITITATETVELTVE